MILFIAVHFWWRFNDWLNCTDDIKRNSISYWFCYQDYSFCMRSLVFSSVISIYFEVNVEIEWYTFWSYSYLIWSRVLLLSRSIEFEVQSIVKPVHNSMHLVLMRCSVSQWVSYCAECRECMGIKLFLSHTILLRSFIQKGGVLFKQNESINQIGSEWEVFIVRISNVRWGSIGERFIQPLYIVNRILL